MQRLGAGATAAAALQKWAAAEGGGGRPGLPTSRRSQPAAGAPPPACPGPVAPAPAPLCCLPLLRALRWYPVRRVCRLFFF